MSIVAGAGTVSQPGSGEPLPSRLSSHRSDHEIHTPEHRSNARLEQVSFSWNNLNKCTKISVSPPLLMTLMKCTTYRYYFLNFYCLLNPILIFFHEFLSKKILEWHAFFITYLTINRYLCFTNYKFYPYQSYLKIIYSC